MELLASLRARLADAEQKVSLLVKNDEGADVLVEGSAADTSDELRL